jgi:hypothetical protein
MNPIESAIATTDAFLATFNDGDAAGHAATLAYPHVRIASGRVRIWESIEVAVPAIEQGMAALRNVGWDHSVWDHRNVIHARESKVHLDVQFTRYRSDGSVIGEFPAIYVIVEQDGRWLIQCRSSFAP